MFDPYSDTEEQDAYEQQLGPNPALNLASHPHITPPPKGLVLYYGKTEGSKRIDLPHAPSSALDDLERTCDPATFGVAQRTVLNPNYRKAGQLDNNHFAFNFDVERYGLLEAIRTRLFIGKEQARPVRAELYKLNVYGKGCFFKGHKDTPRSSTMFASLVLILPTPHSGGTLMLRQGGNEWSFDAASVIADAAQNTPRLAYIAFFSDVEHAVTEVTSGHRVTITYNLYYATDAQNEYTGKLNIIEPPGASAPEVKSLLATLLDDDTFLPEGGTLGFGLRHLYPLPTTFAPGEEDTTLAALVGKLKGTDAALFRACAELLAPRAPALYAVLEAHGEVGADGRRALVACPRVVVFHSHNEDEEPPVWEKLCRNWGGVLLNYPPGELSASASATAAAAAAAAAGAGSSASVRNWTVHWVTPLSGANRVKMRVATYGNEPMIGYLYQRICILVNVGPAGRRACEE
ncbi:hypothetical protein BD413DRAFT_605304 [Trametes elegans]|nr:hypothetical protein BD413DRAFT_605304 [Trametes elegans]